MSAILPSGSTLQLVAPGVVEGMWLKVGPRGIQGDPGVVQSVNGKSETNVVLDHEDVGAASAAQGAKADTAVQPDDLADVATTGAYSDLLGRPTLGTAAARDIGSASTDVAAGNRGLPAGGATGQVIAKQSGSDYDVMWQTPAAGSSSAPLAVVTRTAATASTYTTTSTTPVDVDATNLAITFDAPASGNVMIYLSGTCAVGNVGSHQSWFLRQGSTNVPGTARYVIGGATTPVHVRVGIRLTGLTPELSYTYKWGWRAYAPAGPNIVLHYGNTNNEFSGADPRGPLVMEAYAS